MLEIERKFLIEAEADEWRAQAVRSFPIVQGYFQRGGDASVRVRITGNTANLNIKGPGGLGRAEYTYDIPVQDAEELMSSFCGTRIVAKTRYIVPAENGLVWEIDEYHGRHAGHFTAELELPAEDTPYNRPKWLGREVTGIPQYFNAALAESGKWPEE